MNARPGTGRRTANSGDRDGKPAEGKHPPPVILVGNSI